MHMPRLMTWMVFACFFATVPTMHADDDPAEAPTRAVQTRDGVTLRIEKVSFDRILNGAGWLRKVYSTGWQEYVPKDFHSDSFRVARIFVSVNGGAKGTSSYEFGTDPSRVTRISGAAEFDPPLWQRQLPDIEVDEAARGYIFWAVIEGDTAIDAVFPATVGLEVITEGGKKTKFVFDDLGLKSNQ
jgi:hypothetical protein